MAGSGIVSIGECMLELSGRGGEEWRMGFAGDTLNTLWALRALTGSERVANYISAFGDDPFSKDQIEFFQKNDIGIGQSPIVAGARPGLYAITLAGAERSFTYWRSDSAARKLASDPERLAKSLEGQALAYFSGITLAILEPAARQVLFDALRAARGAGSIIAFDPNYRPRLWTSPDLAKAAFDEALGLCDIALPTFPDEQALYGDASPEATAQRLGKVGVKEIVIKNGELAALVCHDGASQAVPAIHVANPIDTTGAGDSFNGSYLAARLAGFQPHEATTRAHAVAAAVVQVRGALAPFETLRLAAGLP